MTSNTFEIREMRVEDMPQTLALMRALARFEDYIDQFNMDEEALANWVFEDGRFNVLVAARGEEICAYASFYIIEFTYDQKPTMILKELFAKPEVRGQGLGGALFERVKLNARTKGAARLQWLVLTDNNKAQAFYTQHGGAQDCKWQNWHITI